MSETTGTTGSEMTQAAWLAAASMILALLPPALIEIAAVRGVFDTWGALGLMRDLPLRSFLAIQLLSFVLALYTVVRLASRPVMPIFCALAVSVAAAFLWLPAVAFIAISGGGGADRCSAFLVHPCSCPGSRIARRVNRCTA